ncbi:WD_REPEATS_REGION domain-containing protein, partial [Haematococcus lacustris]
MEVPPPLNLSGLPDSLAATLQHIVGQLDVLTQ